MRGKYLSEETKLKISLAKKGKPNLALKDKHLSEDHKQKLSLSLIGKDKHQTGKVRSIETREKMSLAAKARFPFTSTLEYKKKMSDTQKIVQNLPEVQAKRLATMNKPEVKEKMRLSHLGKFLGVLSPRWTGTTPIIQRVYMSDKYKVWRFNIFLRDGFTCQSCKRRAGKLQAHHIKRFVILLAEAKEQFPLFNLYDAAMLYLPL